MRNHLPIALVLVVGCASNAPAPDPEPQAPLVTRKMEPFMPRPERPVGTRAEPTDQEFDRLEEVLQNEAATMEVIGVVAIDWADGGRSVYATHVNYPAADMNDAALDSVVDDDAVQACDEQYQDCLDATDRCDEEGYDACVRAAYRNPYIYASFHLGLECGIFGVSRFDIDSGDVTMVRRETLDSMVCDFDALGDAPAATDLDGDSGPELVYSWFSSSEDSLEAPWPRENIAILDADSLGVQYRMTADDLRDDVTARTSTIGLDVQDPNDDGMFDLIVSRVDIRGYCPEMGFALDKKFVVPTDEYADEEPPCQMSVHRSVLPYDGESDRWGRTANPVEAPPESTEASP